MTRSFSRKIFFSLILALFAAPALAVDGVDKAAIEDLRALVAAECKTHPQCPLDDIFSRLQKSVMAKMTVFNGVVKMKDKEDDMNSYSNAWDFFPKARPKGVTLDEWRALRASGIDGKDIYAEIPNSYKLLDLDGDGRRDLIIVETQQDGETDQLFTRTRALRQKAGKFEEVASFQDGDQGFLYELGTGNRPAAYWIRLRGRVYAILHTAYYGADEVVFLRPFVAHREVPMLTVRYHYQLSVSVAAVEENGYGNEKIANITDDKLSEALTAALQVTSDKYPALAKDNPSKTPLCPIPASAADDERKRYYAFDIDDIAYDSSDGRDAVGGIPVWYDSFDGLDSIGDLPIQVGDTCYIGRLYGGAYTPSNPALLLIIRKPNARGTDYRFDVSDTRKGVSSVEILTIKCDENGCY